MVTGDGYGYYVVLVFFISSCIFFIFLVFGDGYGRWLREKTLGLLRSLGFLHFFVYFLHFLVFGDGYGRWLREKALGLLRSLGFLHFFLHFLHFSCIWGWLREMVTGEDFEGERQKERHREIRQIKLFGVERGQFGTEREGERERERERQRDTSNQPFWGGKTPIRKREREGEKETHRDTSKQASWGGKMPIWDRQGGRKRKRDRDTSNQAFGWKDSNLGQRGRESVK